MGEDSIKSAFQRAWEKAEKVQASEAKLKELQYEPEGARLVARFLQEDKVDLVQALSAYPPEIRKYVERGANATLGSNINLPRTPRLRRDGERALEGLMALKRDKSRFASVKGKVESLFAYHERARQEAYNNLRQEFDAALRQALRQQTGVATQMNINVEGHPEFRQKWQELSSRLDMEFEERLKRIKEELERVS